ncbi:MAG: hypothetical protein ACLFTE_02320 [Salinivenus sp.]
MTSVDWYVPMNQLRAHDELILMWSGGKDAALALDVLHSQSPRRIGALLTTVRDDDQTVTMHGTPRSLIERQADRLDLPLHIMSIPNGASNAVYEKALHETLQPIVEQGSTTVVAGDLFLDDVKAYRERVLREAGVRPLFPLWKRDTDWLARHFLRRGYRALVVSVDSVQLDPSFVGRTYDEAFLEALPASVDPCGEHGAFHTLVVDGPPFRDRVPVRVVGAQGDGRMHYATLEWDE